MLNVFPMEIENQKSLCKYLPPYCAVMVKMRKWREKFLTNNQLGYHKPKLSFDVFDLKRTNKLEEAGELAAKSKNSPPLPRPTPTWALQLLQEVKKLQNMRGFCVVLTFSWSFSSKKGIVRQCQ